MEKDLEVVFINLKYIKITLMNIKYNFTILIKMKRKKQS